jgi:hypothetical protein
MKIFKNNLKKNTQVISLRNKIGDVGKTKYFPSFTKEWTNTIYSFNKNIIKNIPVNFLNLNKIIQSYFDLYFKYPRFLDKLKRKGLLLRKRRNLLRRIFVSNAEIKYTNNKAVITLYIVNREKRILTKKFWRMNKAVSKLLFNRCSTIYRNRIVEIYTTLNKFKNEYSQNIISKKNFVNTKFGNFNTFIRLKHLYIKKIWSILLIKYSLNYLRLVRKLHLSYSLNQYKFNKVFLLPKLSTLLTKIVGKKIEYNLINLKSIAYNTDIFTNVLALKLKNKKNFYGKIVPSIFNRAPLPVINTIMERTFYKKGNSQFLSKNLKIISHLSDNNSLDMLLNTRQDFNLDSKNNTRHSLVYNSIGYKNLGGIRLEIKGRLTKRYRADRSIYFVKWKGGLKNIDSSFQRLSSVLFRGNTNSNTSYSFQKGKRRIGAFAVKGWIGGK